MNKTQSDLNTDDLVRSKICAAFVGGLTAQTPAGHAAIFAVLDENGRVVDSGDAVSNAIWRVCLEAHKKFWLGNGHIKVLNMPSE
jgi:hypothetical protein